MATTPIPGVLSYIGYAYETTFGTAGSPINKAFGHGQTITTLTERRNYERVFGLGFRNAVRTAPMKFEGTATVEFTVGDGYWLKGALGSVATESGAGPYFHIYNESNTVPSITVENGLSTGSDIARTLLGGVINSLTLTSAVGELVKGRAELLFSNEKPTATLIAEATRPVSPDEPFTFAGGNIQIGGATIGQIQRFEVTINNNAEMVWGMGNTVAVAKIAKQRIYDMRATVAWNWSALFLERLWGATGSPLTNTVPAQTTVNMLFDNGLSGTASWRGISLALGSVFIDEHNLPQDPTTLITEEVSMQALYCASGVYINNVATAL